MPDTCDPQAAADLMRALAHPMRLRILCRLLEGELSVSGFEAELGLRQPNLSQQLAALREAELVATRREAKSIVYRLADPGIGVLLDALRTVLGGSVTASAPARSPAPARLSASLPPLPLRSASPQKLVRGGECGVFAMAGWAGGQGGTSRG